MSDLLTKTEDSVLTITLNRPEKRNAFDAKTMAELVSLFSNNNTSSPRAIIIRGNGPVFCAGGDIHWMQQMVTLNHSDRVLEARKIAQLFRAVYECPIPTVAIVHGAVLGGALGIVASCDIVVAEQETLFAVSEATLGIVPACLAAYLIRKIGPAQCKRLMLTGKRIDATEAKSIGLVQQIVVAGTLERCTKKICSQLQKCSPVAQRKAKKLFHDLEGPIPDEKIAINLLAEMWASPDGQEGMKAFLEKRKPLWDSM